MAELDDKTVLVTGASRGIGLAIGERMAKAGAHVALCSRNQTLLAGAAQRIADARPGARVLWVPCDVTRFDQVRHLHATVDRELGVPDVIVNNAGLVVRKRLD